MRAAAQGGRRDCVSVLEVYDNSGTKILVAESSLLFIVWNMAGYIRIVTNVQILYRYLPPMRVSWKEKLELNTDCSEKVVIVATLLSLTAVLFVIKMTTAGAPAMVGSHEYYFLSFQKQAPVINWWQCLLSWYYFCNIPVILISFDSLSQFTYYVSSSQHKVALRFPSIYGCLYIDALYVNPIWHLHMFLL